MVSSVVDQKGGGTRKHNQSLEKERGKAMREIRFIGKFLSAVGKRNAVRGNGSCFAHCVSHSLKYPKAITSEVDTVARSLKWVEVGIHLDSRAPAITRTRGLMPACKHPGCSPCLDFLIIAFSV